MNTNVPDPDKRITNSDEQDVAVNHSTREEGGYDEPVEKEGAESARREEKDRNDNKESRSSRSEKIN